MVVSTENMENIFSMFYWILVEFYEYTNANDVLWLAEPLHTI